MHLRVTPAIRVMAKNDTQATSPINKESIFFLWSLFFLFFSCSLSLSVV